MTDTHAAPATSDGFGLLEIVESDDSITGRNDSLELTLERGDARLQFGEGVSMRCVPAVGGQPPAEVSAEVRESCETLLRVRYTGTLGDELAFSVTTDLFQSRNVHVYVRVEALRDTTVASLELPRLEFGADVAAASDDDLAGRRSIDLRSDGGSVGVVATKLPWKASWNDVGCYDHWTLGASFEPADDGRTVSLVVGEDVQLQAGDTIEAALLLVANDPSGEIVRAEATYDLLDETRYVPEGERRQTLVWETEEVWLGPPITEGAPQRPHDQLIPRPVGLNVLARKRFNWNNEDFSLFRLTGKHGYWESGIKKAHALLATQNEYGGWFEGIEFYNLPPRHHQMYDTYIGGTFLLEAYDATGYEEFLDGARRCLDFWLGEPPANSHTEVGDGGWWYRWGGYINEFGYTDQRLVLNTHSGAMAFMAELYERTGDPRALEAVERGMTAVRWGLENGIQRGDGQFLYCLSQIDPTLERPGDPPYLQQDLVPQIEDVYTIAASYRLMIANRVVRDEVVMDAIGRALKFWWTGYKAGRTVTYRAYAAIAFAIAAGEIDPIYALALVDVLKDPEQFTSMQRGLSSFIAPHGLPRLKVSIEGDNAAQVEPLFVRQESDRLVFAVVNLEHSQRGVGVRVALPAELTATRASVIDPATSAAVSVEAPTPVNGGVRVTVPELREFSVMLVDLELEG